MKKLLAIAALVVLSGCKEKELSTSQQATEIKVCKDAGFFPQIKTDEYGRVVGVRCQPEESPIGRCQKLGGIPTTSAWDGRLTGCIFKQEGK
jgi:hypothetical protein